MADSRDHQRPADLIARFRQAVLTTPDRVAVHGPAGGLTFAQLEWRTARLAARLRALGVGRGGRVGVSVHRGVNWIAAPLAVWRAGAAYVPLDPAYPPDRLAFIAGDAGIQALVSDSGRPGWLTEIPVIAPGELGEAPSAQAPPEPEAAAIDPAYVIYTSGSTGWPKGVEVTRGGVAALVAGLEAAAAYPTEHRVVAWNASLSFDASVQQWARVCRGDTLVVLGDEDRTDPQRLAAVFAEHGVSDVDLTPSHWELLAPHLLPSTPPERVLRLFLGGEPVPRRMWRQIAEASAAGRIEALNLYGPTECTVDAAVARIEGEGPHLGHPLPGVRTHVLDGALRPTPVGVTGELFLAGSGVANGYLNQPGLTAQRFVADPFAADGGRMYRTGDEVRWAASGTLEFVGRTDRQVKIRGFRVELGEIEQTLRAHPGVTAATVTTRSGPENDQLLVAYYVAEPDPTAARLRARCAATLPEFMVPTTFARLDAMPLTVNGKIDLQALISRHERPGEHESGTAPHGELEELIAAVWSEVLGRDGIHANDDFFALGGHSLVALRVVSRLKRKLGVIMPTKDVYRYPRLRDLAEHAESLRTGSA